MPISTTELARRLQATADWLQAGDSGERPLRYLALPKNAGPDTLSFLNDPLLAGHLTRAGAVLVEEKYRDLVPRPLVVSRLALAIANARHWLPVLSVNNSVESAPSSGVHPSAVVEPGVVIADESTIGGNSVITGEVRIGGFTTIGPNVTITGPVSIGNRVRIEANTTIGAKPFMYVDDGCKWVEFPSFAGITIMDGAVIGAGVTIDRGLTGNTIIGSDVKLDNQVHIAHGVRVGTDTMIAARATIAGEATVGERCKIGGACSIAEGVSIADDVVLAGMSAITRSIAKSGKYVAAWPVQTSRDWWRQVAKLKRMAK